MLTPKRRLPSPALVISVIALIAAVGGGTYALAISSQKTKKIAKKVANHQISKREDGLQVGHASSADHADSADRAAVAGNAFEAEASGGAFSDSIDRTPLVTLDISRPGAYVITATLTAENQSSSTAAVLADCVLGTTDSVNDTSAEVFLPAKPSPSSSVSEPMTLQTGPILDSPDKATLECRDLGIGDVVGKDPLITAVPVLSWNGRGLDKR